MIVRIALANIPCAATPEESITRAADAIAQAGRERAPGVCFPECYVPGSRRAVGWLPPPAAAFLERAWAVVADAAGDASFPVVLGTERIVNGALRISTLIA